MKRSMLVALLGVSACVSLSCDSVLGIPERSLDTHIACTDGKCACVGDFGDCDGNVDNGCETDTRNAQAHCGVCGHDCLGGECTDGRCGPVVVDSLESGVSSFALKDGILYASVNDPDNPSGFRRLDMRGPTPTALETPVVADLLYGGRLYAGAKAIIFCDYSSVQSLSLETWAVESLFESQDGILDGCTAGGGAVWWTSEPSGSDPLAPANLSHVREDGGGSVTTVPGPSHAWGLVLVADEHGLYLWDDASNVLMRHPPDGSAPVPVLNTPPSGGVVLAGDAKNLYLGASNDTDNALFAVPRDGANPVELATIGDLVSNGTADAKYVYLADYLLATLSRVPLAGGEDEVIATGQDLQGQHPIYVDERAVYWLGGDAVWRVAK